MGGKKVPPCHEMIVGMAEAAQSNKKLRPALSLSRKKRMTKIGVSQAASGIFHLPPMKSSYFCWSFTWSVASGEGA